MSNPATFTVPDMTCGHCEKALRGAFATAMPGADVQIDLAQHRITVAGDPQQVRAVIAEAGFTPEPA